MPKLILSMDGLVLKEVELTKERTSIGRRPHNDIVIDNLAVSGEHAVLITILNDSFIEDLGSTNGTTVNGQPIKKHFLQNNDTVELGKYKLKFVAELKSAASDYGRIGVRDETARSATMPRQLATTAASSTASSSGPAAVTDPQRATASSRSGFGVDSANGMTMSRTGATTSGTQSAAAAGPAATIQILNGPNAGKELMLSKALTTLGRPGVQVAVITRRQQGYYITHVEGSSFPVVNGKALGLDATALTNHDIIELSGTKMEFFFR